MMYLHNFKVDSSYSTIINVSFKTHNFFIKNEWSYYPI